MKNFFVWIPPVFGHNNRLNLIEDRLKSGSIFFDVVSSLQNSPPPDCKFLATRLHSTLRISNYGFDLESAPVAFHLQNYLVDTSLIKRFLQLVYHLRLKCLVQIGEELKNFCAADMLNWKIFSTEIAISFVLINLMTSANCSVAGIIS